MSRLVLGAALALSVAINAYLLWTRSSARGGSTAPLTSPAQSPAFRPYAPAPLPPSLPPLSTKEDLSKLDRAALEKRLLDAEAEVEKYLPLNQRWERAERTPGNEDRVRPFLDKVFALAPGADKRPYDVECHGDVCRISITDRKAAPDDWTQTLQTSPDHLGVAQGFSFGPDGTFMHVEPPGGAPRARFLYTVAWALHDAKSIAACKQDAPESGTLTITISFDAQARRLRVRESGPLASQPVAACLQRAVEDIVATIVIPDDLTSMPDMPIPYERL